MGVYSNYDYKSIIQENTETQFDIPINEAYFGITPDLERIIKTLHNFRSKYMVDSDRAYVRNHHENMKSKVNTDPDLIKFNRLMEDFFGFGIFNLSIMPSKQGNAYTVSAPIRSNRPLKESDLRRGKNGIMYNKSANVRCCVFISSGIIFNADYTDKEIMAIILHEVGHNFAHFESKTIQTTDIVDRLLKPIDVIMIVIQSVMELEFEGIKLALLYTSDNTYDLYYKVLDKIFSNKTLSGIYDEFTSAYNQFDDILTDIMYTLNRYIPASPANIIKFITNKLNPIALLKLISGFKNEKIADNFPTMYGLGPDLGTALDKLEQTPLTRNSIANFAATTPVLSHISDLMNLPVSFITYLFNEHPYNASRIKNQMRYLKAEIKKEDIDPKMKKDLQDQIDQIDNYMTDIMTKVEATDPKICLRIYKLVMLKIFDGDVRQAIANIIDDDDKYNKKYDNLYNRVQRM